MQQGTACAQLHSPVLPIYQGFNFSRALIWHLGLAQLPSTASILGHNLPQHHTKAVDVNLQVPGQSDLGNIWRRLWAHPKLLYMQFHGACVFSCHVIAYALVDACSFSALLLASCKPTSAEQRNCSSWYRWPFIVKLLLLAHGPEVLGSQVCFMGMQVGAQSRNLEDRSSCLMFLMLLHCVCQAVQEAGQVQNGCKSMPASQ